MDALSCTHMATVGVKWLSDADVYLSVSLSVCLSPAQIYVTIHDLPS